VELFKELGLHFRYEPAAFAFSVLRFHSVTVGDDELNAWWRSGMASYLIVRHSMPPSKHALWSSCEQWCDCMCLQGAGYADRGFGRAGVSQDRH